MSCPRLIHRQPDSAAHSPPSRNLQDQGISRAKPLASLFRFPYSRAGPKEPNDGELSYELAGSWEI